MTPSTRTVFVYSAPDRFVTFGTGEVIDQSLGIQISVEEITVFVYSAPDRFVTFGTGEVIDQSLGIQISVEEIFE